VKLANTLKEEIVAQLSYDNYDRIVEILGELREYTVEHFKLEEQMMKGQLAAIKNDEELALFWAYFRNHKKEHSNFIDKVNSILDKDIDSQQHEVSVSLTEFLMGWLVNHIMKVDMELPKYIKD
jgi:hemerythrin